MKLPIPFLKSNKEDATYYLSLILTDEKVGAVILKAEEGNFKKINASDTLLPESIEEISMDEFISAIDKAISRAEEILPPDIQTHQTVFGVKANWVDSETKKITKEYLEKLKKVCNALDLTPIGFMVTTEAITHLMQDEEGAPLSAIFAEISKKEVTLSLLRGGKVLESVSSPHLESTPATVDKLLGHFTVPVLPARIVIFQSKPDERTSQAFLSHHWSKHLPFLHMPQVTVLPHGFDLRAVIFGAASQMGFKVVERTHDALPKVTYSEADEKALSADELVAEVENPSEIVEDHAAEKLGPSEENEIETAATDFGFVVDQDITERQEFAPQQEEHEEPVHHMYHEEALATIQEPEYEPSRRQKHTDEEKQPFLAQITAMFPKNIKFPKLDGITTFFKGKKAPMKIIIPIVLGIILLASIVLFYFYKMQANVTLTLKPNMVNQDETVTFSTAESNDFGHNLIAAKSISTSINAQVSTPATGKKDVGDKAKGTVTIYNNDNASVSLSSGTVLSASNGQSFTLDNDVKVASASGDIFSGTKPGTTNASVTAKDIGTDGNVPSNTKFTLGNNSNVAGKNDNAFSGGTKKTVTVVSANDLVKLRSDLPKSVQDSAKQKLSSQATDGEAVLPLVSSPTLVNQKFNKNVNDQASQVSLTASVVYTGLSYTKSDLDEYAKSVMKAKYPQDPNIADKSVKETLADAKQRTKDAATATVTIEAGLLPNIDKQDVISNIQSKSLGDAKTSLANLPQVDKADISFSPSIPLLPLVFPRLPRHISVSITSQ